MGEDKRGFGKSFGENFWSTRGNPRRYLIIARPLNSELITTAIKVHVAPTFKTLDLFRALVLILWGAQQSEAYKVRYPGSPPVRNQHLQRGPHLLPSRAAPPLKIVLLVSSGSIQNTFPQLFPTLVRRDDSNKALRNNIQAHQSNTLSTEQATEVTENLQVRATGNTTVALECSGGVDVGDDDLSGDAVGGFVLLVCPQSVAERRQCYLLRIQCQARKDEAEPSSILKTNCSWRGKGFLQRGLTRDGGGDGLLFVLGHLETVRNAPHDHFDDYTYTKSGNSLRLNNITRAIGLLKGVDLDFDGSDVDLVKALGVTPIVFELVFHGGVGMRTHAQESKSPNQIERPVNNNPLALSLRGGFRCLRRPSR
ncbi:hypothetical protein KCU71_g89, partial [Aureobasidium melanogenum]